MTITDPIERVPHDLLVPAIRDVETTVRTLSLHLEDRHRPRVAALLRLLADDVEPPPVEPDATAHGERQLPLFG